MVPNFLSNIPLFAMLASVMLLWSQIKDFLLKVIRLVIVEAQVHHNASNAVLYYLREHGKRAPTNILKYLSTCEYIRKVNGVKILAYEGARDLKNQWFWFEKNLITVSDMRGKNKETGVDCDCAITIRYLRGTVDIENLIIRAISWYESKDSLDESIKSPRFRTEKFYGRQISGNDGQAIPNPTNPQYAGAGMVPSMSSAYENWKYTRILNYSVEDIGYAKRDFFYVFNTNTKKIKDDVERWLSAKKWYEDKGLLHRRGSLLFGAAGTGKSSLIRKIGQSLDIPVISFELSTMNDREFINFWGSAKVNAPCIVVMEDIDTIFSKRKPANDNIKLSFECLLNCISGVEPAEGVYLFVTTNKLDELDDALGIPNDKGVSTRPGRLDTCFHMGDITIGEKKEIVKHFLSDYPEIGEKLIEESNGCTAAQFSDRCSQKALELYWETKNHETNIR